MRPEYDDPAWCEREYNPRTTVADPGAIMQRWIPAAAATRARLAHDADVSYGPHPRQVMDIFRAKNPRGAFVFIHGGYWRALSKNEFSWVADALVPRGVTVAVLNYPLCPEVTVGRIAEGCRAAVVELWARLGEKERGRLVIGGHSAGGYLTADLCCTDWSARGLPRDPFVGAVPISGVFELAPLLCTSMNAEIRMTAGEARQWSLHEKLPLVKCPVDFVVGADESNEFHRQSRRQHELWRAISRSIVSVPGRNHYDVVEGLREPGTELFSAIDDRIGNSASQ